MRIAIQAPGATKASRRIVALASSREHRSALSTLSVAAVLYMAVLAPRVFAQVENFRITEVDAAADQVEVTNTGAAHTTVVARPFCHRFDYLSNVPAATSFGPGEALLFTVTGLDDTDSDLWLYVAAPFIDPANIIHGLKYGPETNVGRTGLAATVGLWPDTSAAVPSPPAGTTLAWDGFGFAPADWYIDETPSLGAADVTAPGTVASTLAFPAGTQDFESVQLGDEVIAIDGWTITNTSTTTGIFTARVVSDLLGTVGPRPGSSSARWLRIRDQDDGDVQNRFYTVPIVTPDPRNYRWSFFVNLEEEPPDGAVTMPRLMVQHRDGAFVSAWGIEFTAAGANLIVTDLGGTPASAALYALAAPTGIGDWVGLELAVDLDAQTVAASVNGEAPVSLPIDLAPGADPQEFRFCYRGEGAGNVNTMLLDDVSVEVTPLIAVEPAPAPAAVLELAAPAPNPTAARTTFELELPLAAAARLAVYDVRGRQVAVVAERRFAAGRHAIAWDGRDLAGHAVAAGVYFARLVTPGATRVRKLLIVP